MAASFSHQKRTKPYPEARGTRGTRNLGWMSSRAEASQARAASARVGEVHEEQWKKRDSVHAGTHGNYGNY